MKSTVKNINSADYFFDLLSNLNSDSKLELISRLSKSLKSKPSTKEVSLRDLFGAFQTKKSSEELISDIKSSRNFSRKTESL